MANKEIKECELSGATTLLGGEDQVNIMSYSAAEEGATARKRAFYAAKASRATKKATMVTAATYMLLAGHTVQA